MPSFIPATGRTQHVAGVCLNRIGKVYSCARVGAALAMKVEDVFTQNRRLWVRLREKGGKAHAMPCHHNLEEYLTAYLDGLGLRDDPKGPLGLVHLVDERTGTDFKSLVLVVRRL